MAFQGYNPDEGIVLGRRVATERITSSVPRFVVSVEACWNALSPTRRARVVGYHPGLLPVLVAETVKLRALSVRYDRTARVGAMSRAQCKALAKDALRTGRDRRDAVVRGASCYVATDAQYDTLSTAKDSAETPERLAQSMEAVAAWLMGWLGGMRADARQVFEQMGFHEASAAALRTGAQAIRDTQADLDALGNATHVTQRQLDEQDGRVLHLVGTIWTAFACASREDEGVVLPDLDALATMFDRRRGRGGDRGGVAPQDDSTPKPPSPQ